MTGLVTHHQRHPRSGGGHLRHLFLLATAVGIAALGATSAHAALTVTYGYCAPPEYRPTASGPCLTGSNLRLDGTDLDAAMTVTIGRTPEQQAAITCTNPTVNADATVFNCVVAFDNATIPDGEYPMTVTSGGTTVPAGNLVLGDFPQQDIDSWNKNVLPDAKYVVTGVSSTTPSTGDNWTIHGTFDLQSSYKILFYNKEPQFVSGYKGNKGKTPRCDYPTVTDGALTCDITVDNDVMGAWKFLVQVSSTKAFVPGSTTVGPFVVMPAPVTVTSAKEFPLRDGCFADSSKCVTGSGFTIMGTNFNGRDKAFNKYTVGDDVATNAAITCESVFPGPTAVSCTLVIADGAPTGSFPLYVEVQLSEKIFAPKVLLGTVTIGSFPPQTVAGWNANTLAGSQYQVSSVSRTSPSTGDRLVIYGSFSMQSDYKILFYNTEDSQFPTNNGRTPTCVITQVLPDSITCIVAVEKGVMGMWKFLVQDTATGLLLPGSTALSAMAVNPTLPAVASSAGACAQDSTKCVTGAELTLTGSNFNPLEANYNRITVGDDAATKDAVQCTPTAVTATTLTCQLAVGSDAKLEAHPVYAQVQVSSSKWSPSARIGSLVLATDPNPNKVLAGYDVSVPAAQDEFVGSVSSTQPSTGDSWTIYGRFDTTQNYKVLFTNTDSSLQGGNGDSTPACTVSDVASFALTCAIKVDVGVMGAWKLQVQDTTTSAFLPVPATLPLIAVNPPLPTVTGASGDCAQDSTKCVTGAELTLTGSNFNARSPSYNKVTVGSADSGSSCAVTAVDATSLTCTLSVKDGAVEQALQLFVQVQVGTAQVMSPQQPAGVVLLGSGNQLLAGWHATAPVIDHYAVAGTSNSWPSSGDQWTIYGSFNTAATYTVTFVNSQPTVTRAAITDTPVCKVSAVAANGLTCTVTAESGVMGTWKLQVHDTTTNALLPVPATLPLIAVNPPLPTVTGASGACAQDSSKCVTGAELTLTGSNFNTRSPSYNKVTVGSADSGSSCAVTKVDATSLTCTLSVKDGNERQALQLAVQTQVGTPQMMSPPQPAGTLVLRGQVVDGTEGSEPGWGVEDTKTDGRGSTTLVTKSRSGTVWMVLTIIFASTSAVFLSGILFLIFCGRHVRKSESDSSRRMSGDSYASGDFASSAHAPNIYGIKYVDGNSSSERKNSLDSRDDP